MVIYVILELLKVPRPQVAHIRIQDRVMWAYEFPHYDMANSSVVFYFIVFFMILNCIFLSKGFFYFRKVQKILLRKSNLELADEEGKLCKL